MDEETNIDIYDNVLALMNSQTDAIIDTKRNTNNNESNTSHMDVNAFIDGETVDELSSMFDPEVALHWSSTDEDDKFTPDELEKSVGILDIDVGVTTHPTSGVENVLNTIGGLPQGIDSDVHKSLWLNASSGHSSLKTLEQIPNINTNFESEQNSNTNTTIDVYLNSNSKKDVNLLPTFVDSWLGISITSTPKLTATQSLDPYLESPVILGDENVSLLTLDSSSLGVSDLEQSIDCCAEESGNTDKNLELEASLDSCIESKHVSLSPGLAPSQCSKPIKLIPISNSSLHTNCLETEILPTLCSKAGIISVTSSVSDVVESTKSSETVLAELQLQSTPILFSSNGDLEKASETALNSPLIMKTGTNVHTDLEQAMELATDLQPMVNLDTNNSSEYGQATPLTMATNIAQNSISDFEPSNPNVTVGLNTNSVSVNESILLPGHALNHTSSNDIGKNSAQQFDSGIELTLSSDNLRETASEVFTRLTSETKSDLKPNMDISSESVSPTDIELGITSHVNIDVEPEDNMDTGLHSAANIDDDCELNMGQADLANGARISPKSHKRKQARPMSFSAQKKYKHINPDASTSENDVNFEVGDIDEDISDESDMNLSDDNSDEIKQKPLYSKLFIKGCKKVRHSRQTGFQTRLDSKNCEALTGSQLDKQLNRTAMERQKIEESMRSNIPCTTNRYRRHFLKQVRKAGAKRLKELEEEETKLRHNGGMGYSNEDLDSDDAFDENVRKLANDGGKECKVCGSVFESIGLLTAHFICHSAVEKEHANMSCVNTNNLDVATYFCHICNERFDNINTLQAHMTDHSMDIGGTDSSFSSKSDYDCSICQQKFPTSTALHIHNKVHTGDNPYTCTECFKSFRDKTRLTTHQRVHTGERPFVCDVCQKTFSQKGNLKLHQKIHTGERDCVCDTCDHSFRSKSDLVRHVKIHGKCTSNETTGNQKFPVSEGPEDNDDTESTLEIGEVIKNPNSKSKPLNEYEAFLNMIKSSSTSESSDEHAKLKSFPKSLTTDALNTEDYIKSITTTALENLMKKQDKQQPVLNFDTIDAEVDYIKFMTNSKQDLTTHDDITKSLNLDCPMCTKSFTTLTSFNEHILSHNIAKSVASSYNAYSSLGLVASTTGTPVGLITPSRADLPSGVKKVYRCRECILDFTSFPEFQAHLKLHKTDVVGARVTCPVCQKEMGGGNLLDHMRIHTGEKPYTCIHCGKMFRRSHHLQTHLRTHTGDRPYTCAHCSKTFARGDHLQNHKRTHTGEKPYRCDLCNKMYSQSHHLLRHKRTHTGEKPYACVMCDKKFSRDHHLKKHMETHKVVIFADDQTGSKVKVTDRFSSEHSKVKSTKPKTTVSMATRSSDRIASILGRQGDNSASKLMESMVVNYLGATCQSDSILHKVFPATSQSALALHKSFTNMGDYSNSFQEEKPVTKGDNASQLLTLDESQTGIKDYSNMCMGDNPHSKMFNNSILSVPSLKSILSDSQSSGIAGNTSINAMEIFSPLILHSLSGIGTYGSRNSSLQKTGNQSTENTSKTGNQSSTPNNQSEQRVVESNKMESSVVTGQRITAPDEQTLSLKSSRFSFSQTLEEIVKQRLAKEFDVDARD